MLDPDPLDTRFAAFREASIATTQRPGVTAVRRTVARRRAVRALAAGAFTVLIAGMAIWSTHQGTVPNPAASASSSPTAAVTASPTTAANSPAPVQPIPPTSSGTPAAAGQAAPTCPTRQPNFPQVVASDPISVTPSNYFAQCRDARLRILGATYEWDTSRQQYRLINAQNSYLTAATPTLPMPKWKPDALGNACGYAFVSAWTDLDPPTVLPASMSDAQNYYASRAGFGYSLEIFWNTRTPADLALVPACQPPNATPSATP
jgi:hypothetical protein